ncbi:hypothetical protein M23134_07694 [Microscilla marina ATCC 23134]|uniref:Uncharacterized protein n=1 Tax=Microscilla marina ATCC 23134 TaxID=313606 RepID=A1ZUX8_MICM2|nr:hypothetical protein M23134_07694 [Microscilla marina ATCC 23134]
MTIGAGYNAPEIPFKESGDGLGFPVKVVHQQKTKQSK